MKLLRAAFVREYRERLGRLEMVARDGFEPPTPAFSGLRSTT